MINSDEQSNLYEGKPPGTPNDGGLKAFFPDQKDLDEAEKVSVSKALTQIAWIVTDYRRGLLAAGMPEIVADVLATELQDKLWTMGLTGRPTL